MTSQERITRRAWPLLLHSSVTFSSISFITLGSRFEREVYKLVYEYEWVTCTHLHALTFSASRSHSLHHTRTHCLTLARTHMRLHSFSYTRMHVEYDVTHPLSLPGHFFWNPCIVFAATYVWSVSDFLATTWLSFVTLAVAEDATAAWVLLWVLLCCMVRRRTRCRAGRDLRPVGIGLLKRRKHWSNTNQYLTNRYNRGTDRWNVQQISRCHIYQLKTAKSTVVGRPSIDIITTILSTLSTIRLIARLPVLYTTVMLSDLVSQRLIPWFGVRYVFAPVSLKNEWGDEKVIIWKITVYVREQVPLRAEAPRETLTAIHQSWLILLRIPTALCFTPEQGPIRCVGPSELHCVGTALRFTTEQVPIRCVGPRGPSERCFGLSKGESG